MKGDVVHTATGEPVVLVDIGITRLYEDRQVRIWDVSLEPGECHPWHLHHNPYVVLSINGSDGRMDWLDGTEPRFISEYRGGAVYRPVSPVHRLTNIGSAFYRNRLIELKDLGENAGGPIDIGPGDRSVQGQPPGDVLPDGRVPVLLHNDVAIWTLTLAAGETRELDATHQPHVIASLEIDPDDETGGVHVPDAKPYVLINLTDEERTWFVVELRYDGAEQNRSTS
ncbi:hypothetical protein HPO96_05230 [Kribbella sandramycini]|uniref:Cupin n=1 Tax=Kribbella sandramycini TaxID=60450 RepID=A0A7Y4KVY9_9ACTN|nr:hypothetical protein [Kribbella sandramycini]MBB6567761.1 hypothetical protein [Kribbella sandramycini]NOL39643.1 hypothetical protein [Kribbella sandramycini]